VTRLGSFSPFWAIFYPLGIFLNSGIFRRKWILLHKFVGLGNSLDDFFSPKNLVALLSAKESMKIISLQQSIFYVASGSPHCWWAMTRKKASQIFFPPRHTSRVARWFLFNPKIPIWVNFGGL
jgi:hypothetical protein